MLVSTELLILAGTCRCTGTCRCMQNMDGSLQLPFFPFRCLAEGAGGVMDLGG